MAWRPHELLRSGELSNVQPGLVTGHLILNGMADPVMVMLQGDFHRDIRGASIKLRGSDQPVDFDEARQLMEGFSKLQTGSAGDITAGLEPFDYVRYPYIGWYSHHNGRVVLELEPEQLTVIGTPLPWAGQPPIDAEATRQKLLQFLADVRQTFADKQH